MSDFRVPGENHGPAPTPATNVTNIMILYNKAVIINCLRHEKYCFGSVN